MHLRELNGTSTWTWLCHPRSIPRSFQLIPLTRRPGIATQIPIAVPEKNDRLLIVCRCLWAVSASQSSQSAARSSTEGKRATDWGVQAYFSGIDPQEEPTGNPTKGMVSMGIRGSKFAERETKRLATASESLHRCRDVNAVIFLTKM